MKTPRKPKPTLTFEEVTPCDVDSSITIESQVAIRGADTFVNITYFPANDADCTEAFKLTVTPWMDENGEDRIEIDLGNFPTFKSAKHYAVRFLRKLGVKVVV